MNNKKEWLYVGYYLDENDTFILKVGTTNNLERRRKEHTRNYRKTPHHPMPQDREFHYLWSIPLSKYNTLRYEDKTKAEWKEQGFGIYIRNDRFVCENPPKEVEIKIRKNYKIALDF